MTAEVCILAARRTPIGKIRGSLASVRADDLLATVFADILEGTGVPSNQVDEVFAGCANQAGEDNRNVARMAWLLAKGDESVPAVTVNRLCASGLEAVIQAYRAIALGTHQVVLAGGVESMSRAPLVMSKGGAPYATGNRTVYDSSLGWRFPNPKMEALFPLEAMGETAENIQSQTGIGRERQDAFAFHSHQKALAAIKAGRFVDEIVPITIKERKSERVFNSDEGPRADTSLEKLGTLRAAFREGGSVTAGNSSSLNDGAAAIVLASREWARAHGLTPLATINGAASAGVNPRTMGLGPIPATQKLVAQTGLSLDGLDLIEINEAFAVQALAVIDALGLDEEKVNVNGGAIALGHPLGCSGARILTTLVHELRRRDCHRGLATLCVGVGQGSSLAVERLA